MGFWICRFSVLGFLRFGHFYGLGSRIHNVVFCNFQDLSVWILGFRCLDLLACIYMMFKAFELSVLGLSKSGFLRIDVLDLHHGFGFWTLTVCDFGFCLVWLDLESLFEASGFVKVVFDDGHGLRFCEF